MRLLGGLAPQVAVKATALPGLLQQVADHEISPRILQVIQIMPLQLRLGRMHQVDPLKGVNKKVAILVITEGHIPQNLFHLLPGLGIIGSSRIHNMCNGGQRRLT